ncbi:hypothetical protein [Foetidibacter luteolus]|uniref:hypothetical protein n=1 Tax=Foetidibacter luteolus TaxID=2608880 RepID=UPI00129ADE76|nr:hypothetical protein [Foetidibacter luteolus]
MIFFDEELFNLLPLIILFILTVFYLVKNINQYHGNGKIITLIPALMGVMFLVLIFGHKLIRSHLDESETYFTAENYNIGNDGGITLDFKTNKHLKGFRIDHFSETYYWGSYTRYADTFELDIPLDFTKSKYAVLKRDTLYFIGDTIYFSVYNPR